MQRIVIILKFLAYIINRVDNDVTNLNTLKDDDVRRRSMNHPNLQRYLGLVVSEE